MIELPGNIRTRSDMALPADYLKGKWTLVYLGDADCDGWMGIRFQTDPHSEANQILLHTRMLDAEALLQQEALGARRTTRGRRPSATTCVFAGGWQSAV